MHHTVGTTQAIEALIRDPHSEWTWEAAQAIVERIETLERKVGHSLPCDPDVIRLHYAHLPSAADALPMALPSDQAEVAAIEELQRIGVLIKVLSDGSVIIHTKG